MANNTGNAPPLSDKLASDDIRESDRSDESHSNQSEEDLTDRNLGIGFPPIKTETSSTSNTNSSASSLLYDEDTGENQLNGNSSEVKVTPNKVIEETTLNNSNLMKENGLLKEFTRSPQDDQIQIQSADYNKSGVSASVVIHGKDMINLYEESHSNHGNTYSHEDVAKTQNTLEVTQKYPHLQSESNNVHIKYDTGSSEACRSIQVPAGLEAAEKEHDVLPNTQAAAAAANRPYIVHDKIKMPGADVNIEKTGDRVSVNSSESSIDVINGRSAAHFGNINNTPAFISMSKTAEVTQPSLMNTSKHQPASLMGAAASNNWVSFEEEEDVTPSQVPSRSKHDVSEIELEGWVKFETSPKMPRNPMMPQLTGDSSVHSCDPASDDRQSDFTMSILSSRGSLSESHDNVHVSHEYLPLAPSPFGSSVSSPSPQLRSTGAVGSWIKFEDPKELPPRQLQSPPLNVPLQVPSPQTVKETAASVSPVSSISSPDHVASQQVSRPLASHNKGHQPAVKLVTGWVSFDQPDTGSSAPTSPVRSQQTEKEAEEKRLQLQQLQQSMALQQQQQIQSRQQQQQQPVIQLPYQQPPQPQVSLPTALQHVAVASPNLPSQSAPYSAGNQASFTIPPSTSTPLPGNPFREEMLRQQNRAASPFNPFQSDAVQTPSTPGGTVSAMWGESPITPGTVTAMWEQFEESSAIASGSPGNPFKMSVNTNVYNAQPQHVALTATPAGEVVPSQPQICDTGATSTTFREQTRPFQTQSSTEQPPSIPTSTSTSAQSTPVSTQPFQRYTKTSKQVMIRASGKRPKVTQVQQDDVVVDSAPFVDEFPRENCDLAEGWPMMLRCPDKKRVAGSRSWKPVRVKLFEGNVIQLFDNEDSLEPFRELPLQCSYEFGDRKLQAYDTLGKIHTVKLLYVYHSEKRRYNTRTPYEKVMNANPLLKLGSTYYNIFRSFISTINEYLMKLSSFRDRGISYKQDAMGVVVSDDYRCRIGSNGELEKQSISVDVTLLAFLSDVPDCSIALNDVRVKGIEVVSRRDIVPNKINQWITLENVELHKCANKNVFVESRCIEFQPLDGCCFSLMKFQTRPRQNVELPLHVKVTVTGEGAYLELRADLLLPARPGKRDPSQITCDNIMVRIPIPGTWIKYFRRERRLGFYSVKSSHGKPDHIKQGSLNPRLLETSVGSAKYEHAYKAIVWRIEKLPERATAFSASHILMCRIHLASHREVPRTPQGDVEVEFTMPQTTASRCTVRSLAVSSDKPSEKRIRYRAHYEYFVEMENKVVLQMLDHDEGSTHCSQQ